VLSGACFIGDAGYSLDQIGFWENKILVSSPYPGRCHIEVTFDTGFTFATDIDFARYNHGPPCGPYHTQSTYTAPTPSNVVINNPTDTCADAGLVGDAGVDRND
jgi:hypothetical protein